MEAIVMIIGLIVGMASCWTVAALRSGADSRDADAGRPPR